MGALAARRPGAALSAAPPGGYRRQKRAVGRPTRGKTAPNRLRRLDQWLLQTERRALAGPAGPVVDLGFGETPGTTLELRARLQRLDPAVEVVGVEIDRERVRAAQALAAPGLRFAHGGFDLVAAGLPPARLVRAMNVLRQYEEAAVAEAWALMGAGLQPGGLLAEGTSDPTGRRLVVNLLRRGAAPGASLRWEATLFALAPGADPDPALFQAVLPKVLIHRCVPGEAVFALLADWRRAFLAAAPWAVHGPRAVFAEAGRQLAAQRPDVRVRPRWLRQGYLLWGGAPGGEEGGPRPVGPADA